MGLLDFFRRKKKPPPPSLKQMFQGFQQVLTSNNEALTVMTELEERLPGDHPFDMAFLRQRVEALDRHVADMVAALRRMSGGRWPELEVVREKIKESLRARLAERPPFPQSPLLVRLDQAAPELLAALGGKAANLARVKMEARLPVPEGVVATLAAYRQFMEQKGIDEPRSMLEKLQERLASLNLEDEAATAAAAQELQDMVLSHPVPEELARALVAEAERLAPEPGQGLAVRSSGAREDIEATFAGQYETFLGILPGEVPERWRQVVASQFSERALIYFKNQGLLLEDAAMGVLIQRLVEAQAAGVMFTADPESGDRERLIISATWGLAAELVGGQVSPDEYVVSKGDGRLLEGRYGRKTDCLVVEEGRLVRRPVAPGLAAAPVLQEEDLATLAGFARDLEDYFGGPQDVEWVKGARGNFYVVQSRPLRIPEAKPFKTAAAPVGAEVLLEGGRVGSQGVAAGPVFRLTGDRSLNEVPWGAVLVASHTTPQLGPVLPRIAALVTDVGSATGHAALVAREYNVPALVDTMRASELLPEGQEVTVDTYHLKVYRGRVEELLALTPPRACPLVRSPVHAKLRAVADLVIPLTLVDRRSPNFRAEGCRTYHDITRFAHEKAIEMMFGLMDRVERGDVPALKLLRLKTRLPLNLHIIDLGGGLGSHEDPVPPEDILSPPMQALWRGISHPGITWAGPVPVNVGGFLHVVAQTAIRPPEDFWDKTYAIVGHNYTNYSCRLGYHFASVDSYCGPVADENFINFVFKGGAADDRRRRRRVQLIAYILERLGFEVEVHADMVRGRFRKRPVPETEERLDLLGRLMAYVRQMDMLMSSDEMIRFLADRFLSGHYERPTEEAAESGA